MSVVINGERYTTFDDYIRDENRVSKAEKAQAEFEAMIIGKLIEAREARGLSQRELAKLSGVNQPAIARLESLCCTPQIDTLFKILNPLGLTLAIVPARDSGAEETSSAKC